MTVLPFIKLHPNAQPFTYAKEHDACMDVYCLEEICLRGGETKIIPTGIAVKIPVGCEGIIRGRSGLASRGIFVHVGTIDETYTGDVGVIMVNHGRRPFIVDAGSRIAQFTIKKVVKIQFEEVDSLPITERNSDGYGSTGL